MTVRRATEADEPTLRELWEEFEHEVPAPPGFDESWEEAWRDLARHVRAGVAAIAEDDEGAVGYVFAAEPEKGRSHVTDAYVRPRARRTGVLTGMLREVVSALSERGVTHVSLDVLTGNTEARAVWERLGFTEVMKLMMTDRSTLEARLAPADAEPSFGSVHVQSDDERAVERIVRRFLPRVRAPSRTVVAPTSNGWIAVYNDRVDEDRDAQRRLARELSDGLGVAVAFAVERGEAVRYLLYERGRMVDEYLSVPDYYGPMATVDQLAFASNPTLVARLTGAEPGRVRGVIRNGASPGDLPPPRELLAEIAALMGIDHAERDLAEAAALPGARELE
ncbi:MAG: GNAT family N-acetyltransferase [Actinomycetota bacterium]|nr:GNAT family N-acetyltransferase [Actinomycetota bacterium]